MGTANKNTVDRVVTTSNKPSINGLEYNKTIIIHPVAFEKILDEVVWKSKMELNFYLIYAEKNNRFFQNRCLAELAASVLHSMVLQGLDI